MDTSRTIMKLERLLFFGVPEHPESTWDRDGHAYVEMRSTGRSASAIIGEISVSDAKVIGKMVYDLEAGTEQYVAC